MSETEQNDCEPDCRCPCHGDDEDPGPEHLPGCALSDPEYVPSGFVEAAKAIGEEMVNATAEVFRVPRSRVMHVIARELMIQRMGSEDGKGKVVRLIPKRRRVILESPYAMNGQIDRNVRYARRALRDSLLRGEAPIASHLLYTQAGVLDDSDPVERQTGIAAGLAWGVAADATVAYVDLGISEGMRQGFALAERDGRPIEERTIGEEG